MLLNNNDPGLKQLAEEIGKALVEELWARLRNGEMLVPLEYYSPRQVSQQTGISEKSLEALRSSRKGPPYYKVGRLVRYKPQDVRDFIEKEGPVK